MTSTNDIQLARLFDELLQVPERVNRLDNVTTIEMIHYCFELKFRHKHRFDYILENVIPVMDNLLVYFNRKFQETKLPAGVLTNFHFHLAMEMILSWKIEPAKVQRHFEKTLSSWNIKGIGNDYEKDIIKQIIEFFKDSDKTRKGIMISDEIRPKLFEGLKPYFDQLDHSNLNDLLAGKELPGLKLRFKLKAVDLGCVFGILCEKYNPKQVFNTEIFVIDWLVTYFETYDSNTNQAKPLKAGTIRKYMTETEYKEKYKDKPKRICVFLDNYK